MMKKHLIKIITPLLALIIVASLVAFPVPVTAQFATNQERAMHFMETMLPIDLSKYTIKLQNEYVMDGIPALSDTVHSIDRKITYVTYQLTSEESELTVAFTIEKGIIWVCQIYTIEGQVIPDKQYSSQFDAVKDFLEKYQTYTKIDSNNLLAMLANVDIAKNSTIVTEDIKFAVTNYYVADTDQTVFDWTYTIDNVDYTWLVLQFDTKGNFISVTDTRVLYTIDDTSINVALEQAIDIALENLRSYSYEMPDGSVVNDFKVGDVAAMLYTTPLNYVDYVLRPYWEVKLFLEETAPGNVFGITVFLWANTGEIISISNMASGGIDYADNNTNPTDNAVVPAPNSNVLIIGVTVGVLIAIIVTGILIIKKKQK